MKNRKTRKIKRKKKTVAGNEGKKREVEEEVHVGEGRKEGS